MIMLRTSFLPGLVVLMIATSFLFVMKHKVHNLNKKLSVVNSQILSERENIHVLNAEMAYLTNPKRIEKMVRSQLNLQSPTRDQIIDMATLGKILHEKNLAESSQNEVNSE